jgi:ribosomal protein L16 Arg81 hydroxylase
MTSRFLENLTLGSLVAPVSLEEFRDRYWEQTPLVIHREDQGFYGDLFTLRDFDDAITRSPQYVKMANAATQKNKSYKTQVAPGLEAILADMRDGGTLVLDQLHNHESKLGMLCRLLAPELGHRLQTNLYLTPPRGKGFSPHWDNHDVFILQVLGSKSWSIEKERRVYPEKGARMGDDGRELRGELMAFNLKQGDLIYIPRGFVHAAECGDEPSLHITLGVTATFFEDFLLAAIKLASQRDKHMREVLPIGFMHGSGGNVVERATAAFRGLADEAFLNEVIEQFRDELVKTFPLDVSGQVEAFFQPTPPRLTDRVGARRGAVYRMRHTEESIQLNYGGRSIVFPNFFREALDFALTTPSFVIRDIPGELEGEERIVFIERLMIEGLVVRK